MKKVYLKCIKKQFSVIGIDVEHENTKNELALYERDQYYNSRLFFQSNTNGGRSLVLCQFDAPDVVIIHPCALFFLHYDGFKVEYNKASEIFETCKV